jgi:hypothetical protein
MFLQSFESKELWTIYFYFFEITQFQCCLLWIELFPLDPHKDQLVKIDLSEFIGIIFLYV